MSCLVRVYQRGPGGVTGDDKDFGDEKSNRRSRINDRDDFTSDNVIW